MQQRILLLGGSHFQIPSIKYAKKAGYYTITCDYLPDNPGHKFADEYYDVSTTDKEEVLNLAKELDIDGIVAYASDPSAPTAAYVAEKLNLIGNPYESVKLLTEKDKYRNFLHENGFNAPKSESYFNFEKAKLEVDDFALPVMIKPVDSSGSKGVNKLDEHNIDLLKDYFDYALKYSRKKRVIIEEFIDKRDYQIDGDVFVNNGEIVFAGYGNQHVDNDCNPYVPMGISFPLIYSKKIENKITEQLNEIFDLLNMKVGAFNIEVMIDKEDNIFIMEIGPRNGGNLIPEVIKYAADFDMIGSTIDIAMGNEIDSYEGKEFNKYMSSYIIHSQKDGKFKELKTSEFIRNNIVSKNLLFDEGDEINQFNGSNDTVGTAILEFNSLNEMINKMDKMNKLIRVNRY